MELCQKETPVLIHKFAEKVPSLPCKNHRNTTVGWYRCLKFAGKQKALGTVTFHVKTPRHFDFIATKHLCWTRRDAFQRKIEATFQLFNALGIQLVRNPWIHLVWKPMKMGCHRSLSCHCQTCWAGFCVQHVWHSSLIRELDGLEMKKSGSSAHGMESTEYSTMNILNLRRRICSKTEI